MIRLRPAALAASLLALAGVACTKTNAPAAGARFRQPASLAVFVGVTLHAPTELRPYLVVANASGNDLSLVDGVTDVAVPSPMKLRTLVIPVADRPSLLAAASLGDGKADVLVAVAGGDSVLQVVETWNTANTVHSDPAETPPLAWDFHDDPVAMTAMPSAPGTAKIAVALASGRVAVATFARGTDGQSIVRVGDPATSAQLPFQPLAIVAMPVSAPGDQTALYVATRDEVAPGVYGVAELSADLSTVRALGARAPTRLVAAARLQERIPGSAASDASAFSGQPLVPRVYAVLDESGCGPAMPIDCGVVALDPTVASGTLAIPPDYAGLMPYRAPMRLPGRALAIAASGPPAKLPPAATGEPPVTAGYMRLYMGTLWRETTGVAAVAADTGSVYFLDLGRFETAAGTSPLAIRGVNTPRADYVVDTVVHDGVTYKISTRLWIQNPADDTFVTPDSAALSSITVTPGFTPDETWAIAYQGTLPSLATRHGEIGLAAAGPPAQLWLALQVGDGPPGPTRTAKEVVRLWDPNLGVAPGDVLVFLAAGAPAGCVGTRPYGTPASIPDSEVEKQFELTVGALLAPTEAYPGGAVSLVAPSATDPAEWTACYEALVTAVTPAAGESIATGLTVTVRAKDLVMTGKALGYAGRPVPVVVNGAVVGQSFALAYPSPPANEDTLAAACPLDGWTGALPAPACDPATCRPACETLVLARKARRLQNIGEDCTTEPADATACATGTASAPARWPPATYPFPIVNGPAFAVQLAPQLKSGSPAWAQPTLLRDTNLTVTTSSGVFPPLYVRSSVSPYGANGAIAFDRSPWTDPLAGYRFYVSYPANAVLDATPSQTPAASTVIQ